MDIFSKWREIIGEETAIKQDEAQASVETQVQDLLQQTTRLWWSSRAGLPAFRRAYSPAQQKENEKRVGEMLDGLIVELKQLPPSGELPKAVTGRLRAGGQELSQRMLGLEPRHIEFIESSGMLAASQAFARQARSFDPNLSAEDIYQAGRNVMTMNLLQLLLNLPVEITPSVFSYSLLYPYSDNYLDDPTVPRTTRLAFNYRFKRRLQGEALKPANRHEEIIDELVGRIESQWPRAACPKIYDSLLAIHAAQLRSLDAGVGDASPYELDVLGISFEKGGTSVLADGYLVAGKLSPEQAGLMFGYGAFTQLMDDLEDVSSDLRAGQMTLFSQTARRWPLDALTSKVFHFGRSIFSDLSAFPGPAAGRLKELIECCVDPLLIDSIGRSGQYYSKGHLQHMQAHFPLRFHGLHAQRKKLIRQNITLERLLDLFVLRQ